jgi:AraC-like DNA-binding protein
MLEFAGKTALASGVLDLGLRAGEIPIQGYGEFGRYVVGAPTLHGAIQNFCATVRSECSEADYYMTTNGTTACFSHGSLLGTAVQRQQHELYALMIMVQVIRLALGEDWHPNRACLQTTIETDLADNDFLGKTNIEFGAPITSVEFPARHLLTRLNGITERTPHCRESGSKEASENLAFDPVMALLNVLADHLRRSEKPTIDKAAVAIGVSKRTLQRVLRSRATTYSELLDQVRFDLAMSLLKDGSTTMTEIAYRLGYSNLAHFSRAFRRIIGISPTGYKKETEAEISEKRSLRNRSM